MGVTRLQRWERAKKWGLNPPEEVSAITTICPTSRLNAISRLIKWNVADCQIKEILTTQEGEDEIDYRENVLHPWLG